MKKLITIATVMAASLLFTGCGGGSSDTSATTSTFNEGQSPLAGTSVTSVTSKVMPLNVGEATAVKAGYEIVDSSDDAVLDIVVTSTTKTVTLISGAASLKMPI